MNKYLAAFFVLAMVLGGGMVFLVLLGILPPGVTLASVASASMAGIIMTAVEDGRAGLKLLFRRLTIWRVGIGYWIFACLFLVPVVLIGSLANPLVSGDALILSEIKPAFPIVPMFIMFFILSGLGQELGWTGFIIPRLQAHYSALTASLIRAILWGAWHIPLFLYSPADHPGLSDFPYATWVAQHGLPLALGVFFLLFVLPWSIIYSWMFNNTRGSLLLVAVLHGSEIWAAYWMMSSGIDPSDLANYWGYGAILFGVASLIAIRSGSKNLSRKYTRIVAGCT